MNDDPFVNMKKTVKLCMSWKANIIKRGLTRAKAKCPYCTGYWHGVLAGPKKHLHMHCDTCGTMLMQ
jgi:hypothetical protein